MAEFRWPAPDPEDTAASGPNPDAIRRLSSIPVANVGDAMDSFGLMAPRIRHLGGPSNLCGVAFTVETHPSDNLALHRAISRSDVAGLVLVVAAGEGTPCALFGELMGMQALRRGVRGLVLDGYIRDIDVLADGQLPVYAVGVHPRRATKASEGRLGWPVACGGVAVSPGDVVLGDAEGIAIVPKGALEEVVAAAEAVQGKEARLRAQLKDRPLGELLGLKPDQG